MPMPKAPHKRVPPPVILSVRQIVELLRQQADARAPENDDAGLLQDLAEQLEREHYDLHAGDPDAQDY